MQIDDAREFIKFLHGAVPWNGTWFGEYAPGERGAYWWRKHLDEAIAALIAAPAAPQQAEPVEQIGWADEFGNIFPMGTWKPAQRTHHDSHKTAWRAVYLHPPAAELARLRAENERLKAGARPYTVTCEPVIDRDWPEAHSVRIRNGGQRFDIGMHLETLEEAEHYATMLRVALGIDAAMTQGKL